MPDNSTTPADACGEYDSYQGHTWIKDLDTRMSHWPLAYVWSHTTKRWRAKREMVRMDRVKLFRGSDDGAGQAGGLNLPDTASLRKE